MSDAYDLSSSIFTQTKHRNQRPLDDLWRKYSKPLSEEFESVQ